MWTSLLPQHPPFNRTKIEKWIRCNCISCNRTMPENCVCTCQKVVDAVIRGSTRMLCFRFKTIILFCTSLENTLIPTLAQTNENVRGSVASNPITMEHKNFVDGLWTGFFHTCMIPGRSMWQQMLENPSISNDMTFSRTYATRLTSGDPQGKFDHIHIMFGRNRSYTCRL